MLMRLIAPVEALVKGWAKFHQSLAQENRTTNKNSNQDGVELFPTAEHNMTLYAPR